MGILNKTNDTQTMNDYWNDPPDEPEPPECCEEIMEVDEAGICRCALCGKTIEPQEDIEPRDEVTEPWPDYTEPPENDLCPHGKEWTACDACDYASDIAYDAAREQRLFR
jgi:hypothetical protein